MPLPTQQVTVLREIGRGKQASVWLARDQQGALVAFKQPLHPDDLDVLAREAERALPLVHPNVCRVFGLGVDGRSGEEKKGIVREYVDGEDLGAYLSSRQQRPLEPGELWPLARGVAAGIDHSHDCGVLHFDLKPGNVLLRRLDWVPKLVDFGLAHRLEGSYAPTAEAAGSPYYMAPEVWGLGEHGGGGEGRPHLRRADIYSFAVLLFRCLAGGPPHACSTAPAGTAALADFARVRDATLAGRFVPSPRIPGPAWQVLREALDADPQRRPARAGLLVERLREAWSRPLLVPAGVLNSDLDPWGRPTRIVHQPDNAPMALVPAQRFQFGHATAGREDNRRVHDQEVSAFYIDVHAVTNGQFARFVHEAQPALRGNWQEHYRPGKNENHPVRGVLYEDAEEYCKWAKKDLPLEIEWECAARAGDGRLYPWGNEPPADGLADWSPSADGPAQVGSYPPYGYGLFDLAGNVAELVLGWYKEDFYAKLAAPDGPSGRERFAPQGRLRLVRGGSWGGPAEALLTVARGTCDPDRPDPQVGFRTVWRPPA